MSKELIERLEAEGAVPFGIRAAAAAEMRRMTLALEAALSDNKELQGLVDDAAPIIARAKDVRVERDALAAGQKQMGEDLIVIQRIHSEQKARLYGEIAMLKADIKAAREQKPAGKLHSDSIDGHVFIPTGGDWSCLGMSLYAHPVPARELTDETIQRHWDEACKDTPQTPGWSRHIRFARAIERYLEGEGK